MSVDGGLVGAVKLGGVSLAGGHQRQSLCAMGDQGHSGAAATRSVNVVDAEKVSAVKLGFAIIAHSDGMGRRVGGHQVLQALHLKDD